MGFTKPCYIRKDTEELRSKLKELGYIPLADNDKRDGLVADRNRYMYSILENNLVDSTYNCGTNENLFLALAALRDDTDKDQIFVNGKGDWGIFRNYEYNSGMEYLYLPNDIDEKNYHKASAEEIIKLFTKNKQ